MKFGRGVLFISLGFSLLLSLSRALAQDPDQHLFIYNESRQHIDEAAIRTAAQPLIAADVVVVIMLAEHDSIDRLSAYIERDIPPDKKPNIVYLLISLDPPLRRIGYAQRWVSSFQPHVQTYVQEEMIPAFNEGDYTGAYVRALGRMADDINRPNPSQDRLWLGLAGLLIALILGGLAYLIRQALRGKLAGDR